MPGGRSEKVQIMCYKNKKIKSALISSLNETYVRHKAKDADISLLILVILELINLN